MPLQTHAYSRSVNGRVISVRGYDSSRAAAHALAGIAERPPLAATEGTYTHGVVPQATYPGGRGVPQVHPTPEQMVMLSGGLDGFSFWEAESPEGQAHSEGSRHAHPQSRDTKAARSKSAVDLTVRLAAFSTAGSAWQQAAADGLNHVLLVVGNNPVKNMSLILKRPDVQEALQHAGVEGAKAVEEAITRAWVSNGGSLQAPYLHSLIADVYHNGQAFAQRMNLVLPTLDRANIKQMLDKYRWRAVAGESVAEARARNDANVLEMLKQGVTHHRWRVNSSNPCKTCIALNGTIVEIGTPFPKAAGGQNLPVYFDLLGPPRHVGCQCDTEPA